MTMSEQLTLTGEQLDNLKRNAKNYKDSSIAGGDYPSLADYLNKELIIIGRDPAPSGQFVSVLVDLADVNANKRVQAWTSSKVLMKQLDALEDSGDFPLSCRIVRVKNYLTIQGI